MVAHALQHSIPLMIFHLWGRFLKGAQVSIAAFELAWILHNLHFKGTFSL